MLYYHCHKEVLLMRNSKSPPRNLQRWTCCDELGRKFAFQQDLNIMQPWRQTEKLFQPRNLPEGDGENAEYLRPAGFEF